MSWDEITREERKCPCRKGKYVIVLEADDWNRMRTRTEINCPACAKKNKEAMSMIQLHEEKAGKMRKVAETEAKKRFLPVFVDRFTDLSKKEVWRRLHKGSNYPALGTFYSHVRSYGSVEAYLEKHFLRKLEVYFPATFNDQHIAALLRQEMAETEKAKQARHDWAAYLPIDE
jgi:hypothetical protein